MQIQAACKWLTDNLDHVIADAEWDKRVPPEDAEMTPVERWHLDEDVYLWVSGPNGRRCLAKLSGWAADSYHARAIACVPELVAFVERVIAMPEYSKLEAVDKIVLEARALLAKVKGE